jgi:hypothetical protein
MLDTGKTAAKRLNYRKCQYAMRLQVCNLQGGRWLEPVIAHSVRVAICG